MGQEAEVMVEVVKMMPPVRTLVIAVAEMVAPPPKVTAAAAPCGGGLYCGHGG